MKLFTVGPVEPFPHAPPAPDIPYFRTESFSHLLRGLETDYTQAIGAPAGSRTAFLTASGTGAVEAAIAALFAPGDRVLAIVAGAFGARMAEICARLGLTYDVLRAPDDRSVSRDDLPSDAPGRYAGVTIVAHETSTGVLHDVACVGDWARRNGALLISDAISSFLADPFDMEAMHVDVAVASSHKALALAPGLAFVTASPRAMAHIEGRQSPSFYLDLKRHFDDGLRGQTPWTPAVGVVAQMRARFDKLSVPDEIERVAALAADLRARLRDLPLDFDPRNASACLTRVRLREGTASALIRHLAETQGLMIQPCGGAQAETHVRIGHIGHLTPRDNAALVRGLEHFYARAQRAA